MLPGLYIIYMKGEIKYIPLVNPFDLIWYCVDLRLSYPLRNDHKMIAISDYLFWHLFTILESLYPT